MRAKDNSRRGDVAGNTPFGCFLLFNDNFSLYSENIAQYHSPCRPGTELAGFTRKQAKQILPMSNESAPPQRKLRLLGTILLVVACFGILVGLATAFTVPLIHSHDEAWNSQADPEIEQAVEEIISEVFLPEGITLETTVRELMEYDRTFFEENQLWFRLLTFLSAGFMLVFAAISLRLALSWRKGVPFGRPTILGLRFLGLLLVLQFVVGWIVLVVPESWHTDLFFWSDLYQTTADWLVSGGPTLSSGILFLILSWVLDYGRMIKEEQALTI